MNTITTDNPAPGPGPEKYTLRITATEEIAAISDYSETHGSSRTGAAHSLLALGARTWLASRASPLPAPCQQNAGIAAQEVTTATDELPALCQQNAGTLPASCQHVPARPNELPSTRQPLWRRAWAAVRPYWPFGCGFNGQLLVGLGATGALGLLLGTGHVTAWPAPIVAGAVASALVAAAVLGRLLLLPSGPQKKAAG